jgi:5-methylcytosine-specific restriction protein B
VFIIDEINRGNLSKIFGELMMLIEPDKRGKEFAIPLAYSQTSEERFFIPPNVHLVGTMNTADRSLAMVDYALRRRFRFITLEPEFKSPKFQEYLKGHGAVPGLIQKIIDRMTMLNQAISIDTKNLGSGYKIGHSYFCLADNAKATEEWYRNVVESEVLPLLKEYWFDDEEKVSSFRNSLLS